MFGLVSKMLTVDRRILLVLANLAVRHAENLTIHVPCVYTYHTNHLVGPQGMAAHRDRVQLQPTGCRLRILSYVSREDSGIEPESPSIRLMTGHDHSTC